MLWWCIFFAIAYPEHKESFTLNQVRNVLYLGSHWLEVTYLVASFFIFCVPIVSVVFVFVVTIPGSDIVKYAYCFFGNF